MSISILGGGAESIRRLTMRVYSCRSCGGRFRLPPTPMLQLTVVLYHHWYDCPVSADSWPFGERR